MRTVTVADAENVIFGLQDEIRRSQEARYDHRLHGVLLVAQGINCCQVAELLGDAPRTVAYWVEKFEQKGLTGLQEGARSGRPIPNWMPTSSPICNGCYGVPPVTWV
jgi:Winged helix-turn helix